VVAVFNEAPMLSYNITGKHNPSVSCRQCYNGCTGLLRDSNSVKHNARNYSWITFSNVPPHDHLGTPRRKNTCVQSETSAVWQV
jgi:hypothetical protein